MTTLNNLYNAASSLNALLKAQGINFNDVDFSCSKFVNDGLEIDLLIYRNGNGFDVVMNEITLYDESNECVMNDSVFYHSLPLEFKTVEHAEKIRELINYMIEYLGAIYKEYYDAERAFLEELNK